MRIALVSQPIDRLVPPVQVGSIAIWSYQVATRAAASGHEIVMFDSAGRALTSRSSRHGEIDFVHTRSGPNRLLNRVSRMVGEPDGIPRFASSKRDLGYAVEVGIVCRRRECDIIHVMNFSQFVPVLRRLNPHAKIVLHMHCEWLTQIDRSVIADRLAKTDLVVGCSDHVTSLIADRFPEHARKCVTVQNAAAPVAGEDVSSAVGASGDVLFVGRVSPEKGIHDLIIAFRSVLKHAPASRLRIVGGFGSAPPEYLVALSSDPNVTSLRRFYDRQGLDEGEAYLGHIKALAGNELGKRIILEGPVDYTGISAHYRNAKILVNPSLSESFGMSLVEAMMHGVPVIATQVGGMAEVVEHNRTGLLVPPSDPVALADSISRLLADPTRGRLMGEEGRKRALAYYTWDAVSTTLLRHYSKLLH